MRKVMVIAPHPDDETIGCGGTLLKHKAQKDQIYWLIITNILTENGWDQDFVYKRQEEISEVSNRYGFEKTYTLNFPTAHLDEISIQKLIHEISNVIIEIKPEVIYLPNRSDIHTDHQIVFKAAYSCLKSFRNPFIKRILMYETLSETEFAPALTEYMFIPNVFVDITDQFERKLRIFEIYKSEIMQSNYPRSFATIESIAKLRGSRISSIYAESFVLLFEQL